MQRLRNFSDCISYVMSGKFFAMLRPIWIWHISRSLTASFYPLVKAEGYCLGIVRPSVHSSILIMEFNYIGTNNMYPHTGLHLTKYSSNPLIDSSAIALENIKSWTNILKTNG